MKSSYAPFAAFQSIPYVLGVCLSSLFLSTRFPCTNFNSFRDDHL